MPLQQVGAGESAGELDERAGDFGEEAGNGCESALPPLRVQPPRTRCQDDRHVNK